MKKIIAFLMAVVFIMSSLALINVNAAHLDHVEYYGANCPPGGTTSKPAPSWWIMFTGSISPCAVFTVQNDVYTNLNCFTMRSNLVYQDWYVNNDHIFNKYCINVVIRYTINYILDYNPVIGNYDYVADGITNPVNLYWITYNDSKMLSTVYMYYSINTEDNLGYDPDYTSSYRTEVYFFN